MSGVNNRKLVSQLAANLGGGGVVAVKEVSDKEEDEALMYEVALSSQKEGEPVDKHGSESQRFSHSGTFVGQPHHS